MAHVVVLDSINEDVFVCGICKSVFHSLQIFLDHKKQQCRNEFVNTTAGTANRISESNKVPLTYENVSVTVPGNIPLQSGEVNQMSSNNSPAHPKLWSREVSCSLCKKSFKKIKSLHAHLKTHSGKPYQCAICGRCFQQNSHLQRHICSHKVWPGGLTETTPKTPEVDLLSYSCSYCDLIFPNYSNFRVHLKNHLSIKKFKCIQGDCSHLFPSMEHLLQHVSSSHDSTVFQCHTCTQNFTSLEDIASHQQSHDEFKKPKQNVGASQSQHKCSLCDAIFKRPEKLSLHLLTENHKKICIHCNKIFASDKRLRMHLQIHSKSKPYHCNVCDSSFHMKKYLSSHMLKHGDKNFVCSICKHKFKRKDLLQRHMKSHQAKKLFKCPFQDTLNCRKEFTRSDKLKLHVKNHTKKMVACATAPKFESVGTVEICIVPLDDNIVAK